MVIFNNPMFLPLALAIVLGFLTLSLLIRRVQKRAMNRFGTLEVISSFSSFVPKMQTSLCLTIALGLLSLAAADPALRSPENATQLTLNAVVALDISRSMMAEDGLDSQSRLVSGIMAVEKLIDTYPDGRFGLVLYTDRTAVYAPSFDHDAVRIILRSVLQNYPRYVRGSGSDALVALREANHMIEELPFTVEVVFLISDGGKSISPETRSPTMASVIQGFRDQNVRIVAVGVGDYIPVGIPVYDNEGVLVGYHEFRREIVYTALDELALRQFALETNGYYLRLSTVDDLANIAAQENLDSQPTAQAAVINLVWLPASGAAVLIGLWLLGNLKSVFPRSS